jgi:S-adenosylmethionine-diacylgycerolhomoserine-N-methlytransferase
MSIASDLKVLYHLAWKPVRGRNHAERMESFYAGQADAYDNFRQRLLQGREQLIQRLDFPNDGVWVDLGGGTGSNLEFAQRALRQLKKVYVVDLSTSLLKVAKERALRQGWSNVEPITADATSFLPPEGYADVVTCSYALTMIPDWFAALANAQRMLRPTGQIGVVDFYVSRKHPADGQTRHGWLTRSGWPLWFAMDNVFPSPDHVPYLHRNFAAKYFHQARAKVPFLPLVRVPYYIFVGAPSQTNPLSPESNS